MTAGATPSVMSVLTRHFFASFFRLSFLDDAGEESLKRVLLGLLVGTIPVGLFIGRLYATKYAGLTGAPGLQDMVDADRMFGLALPMLATACGMALASRSVFPDEVDFRTLMVLPVPRRTIFLAKLLALGGFTAVFVLIAVASFAMPMALVTGGRLPQEPRLQATALHLTMALGGCGFIALAIVACQGVSSVMVSRRWQRPVSMWTQTAMVAVLIFSMPFVLRMSALWRVLPSRPTWLSLIPPAWFWGLQRYLLGDHEPLVMRLAAIAAGAVISVLAATALCSLAIYRRFDQSTLQLDAGAKSRSWNVHWRWRPKPARDAVGEFIGKTLRRSGLHQLVFWGMCSTGAAMAVSTLFQSSGLSERWLTRAALGAPFTMMAGTVVGLRMALLLPTNIRAGWLFRMLETTGTRGAQLDAVRQVLFTAGVVFPSAATLPVLIANVGVQTSVSIAPVTLLIGWAFTEAACLGWRRIPFTCTYLFGRRPPAYTVCLGVLIFGWFVFIATSLVNVARAGVLAWLAIVLLVGLIGLTLRWYRRQDWGRWPLEFEDYLPDGFDALGLHE